MIKMSCTVSKDTMKSSEVGQESIIAISEMLKRALEQHFQFSSQKFADLHISIKFSEDGKANLVLS